MEDHDRDDVSETKNAGDLTLLRWKRRRSPARNLLSTELPYPTSGKGKGSSNIPWVGIC